MKKSYVLIILFSFIVVFSLTSCSSIDSQFSNEKTPQNSVNIPNIQETDEGDELSVRLKQYESFLQDEISSESQSEGFFYLKDFCNSVDPEKEKDRISYALFDMTGDGMPELHVLTDISYSIHTIENNQLITWYRGDRHHRPLNNRAILAKVESTGVHYVYIVLDNKGKEVFSCKFSEGVKNICLFSTGGGDNVELSKSDWDKLTKPLLTIGSDEIVWKNINNLSF